MQRRLLRPQADHDGREASPQFRMTRREDAVVLHARDDQSADAARPQNFDSRFGLQLVS